MAKTKVTVNFEIIELIDNFVDNNLAKEVGQTIVDEAKQMISEGQSPVRGYGRFEGYKDRKSYPGDLKPQRPVNLELSGKMLAAMGHRRAGKESIEIGFTKGTAKEKEIAGYHNEGTDVMAQRKTIPSGDEEWAVTIMRGIRDLFEKRLNFLIRQSNKKNST